MRERLRSDRARSARRDVQHRVTVTVGGGDLVDVLDAMCVLEGCDAGELATKIVVERLLQAQAEDPDVDALVRARRRRRRWLHAVPTIATDGGVRSAAMETDSPEEG